MRSFLSVVFIGILSSFVPSSIDGALVTLWNEKNACSGSPIEKFQVPASKFISPGRVTRESCVIRGNDAIAVYCDGPTWHANYYLNDHTCNDVGNWFATGFSIMNDAKISCAGFGAIGADATQYSIKINCSDTTTTEINNDQIAAAFINDANNNDIDIDQEQETQIDEQQEIQQEVEDLLQQIQEIKHELNKNKKHKKHSQKFERHHRF